MISCGVINDIELNYDDVCGALCVLNVRIVWRTITQKTPTK